MVSKPAIKVQPTLKNAEGLKITETVHYRKPKELRNTPSKNHGGARFINSHTPGFMSTTM